MYIVIIFLRLPATYDFVKNIENYLEITVLVLNPELIPFYHMLGTNLGFRLYEDIPVMDCTHVTLKVPY